jgi:tripartite-type tricarboxylate transporter receptor subunit TctC
MSNPSHRKAGRLGLSRRALRTVAIAVLTIASTASAQNPSGKPLRMVAGMPPGGGADTNARRFAPLFAKIVEQAVVIDNVPGGAGNLAAQIVAAGASDGNTLLFASHPILAINPLLYERLPFNPDQLTPIALMSQTPHILLVNTALPAASVAELVRLAKTRPGTVNFGSGGAGTSLHLAGELLQSMAGITLVHVPYRGSGPAMTALIGNEIQLLFDASMTAIGHIRGGRVRGIAIASLARLPAVPDLPTFNESGLPGFEVGVGHGMLAQAATPAARIATLNRAVNTALADPEYRKQMADLGVVLVGGTPEQFRAYLASERSKWGELIQKRGIKVD